MDMLTIYEEYKEMNNELTGWLETYLEDKIENLGTEITDKLMEKKQQLEMFLEQASGLEDEKHEQDIKDLRYLLTDTLFLIIDLLQMVQYQDGGRFQMRAMNYISKRRRSEAFGE